MLSIQRIHPADDAIVALQALQAGASVALGTSSWHLAEAIPAKQKLAARDFARRGFASRCMG